MIVELESTALTPALMQIENTLLYACISVPGTESHRREALLHSRQLLDRVRAAVGARRDELAEVAS